MTEDLNKWNALSRAQILSATMSKLTSFVNLADQKAQAMIIVNSILIPFAIKWISVPEFSLAAIIVIFTSTLSIIASIFCIYPKRRSGKRPSGTVNLLHYGDIGEMELDDYLERFSKIYNDDSKLPVAVAKDFHDMSKNILKPKYTWLKVTYLTFFIGNLLAIVVSLYNLF